MAIIDENHRYGVRRAVHLHTHVSLPLVPSMAPDGPIAIAGLVNQTTPQTIRPWYYMIDKLGP